MPGLKVKCVAYIFVAPSQEACFEKQTQITNLALLGAARYMRERASSARIHVVFFSKRLA